MRSPEDMRCIQIDITNACIHNCSNCTRMCGHHPKPFFMNWETFKRAVDSLDGFEGEIGMMGGEPTLHPEFERFAEYLNSKYEQPKEENYFIKPTANFIRDRRLEERNLTYTYDAKNGMGNRVKGPGLWSSLASNYYKYYETIQDVFRFQSVNDHLIPAYHQPIMLSRKDMGVSDEEWITLRDNCWIQNVWSATITPKGCFFCEVAGALDMLFDGPGGWPIESGWWKRKPEDFKDQLHWCEFCGIALNTRSRNANEGIDDVSQTLMEKLEKINSPKLNKGQVYLYTKDDLPVDNKDNHKFQFHDNNMNRLSSLNNTIYADHFPIIVITDENDDIESVEKVISSNIDNTTLMIVFVRNQLLEGTQKIADRIGKNIIVKQSENTFGLNINRANKITGEISANIIITSGVRLSVGFSKKLMKYAINPGTYHYLNNKLGGKCTLIEFENTDKVENFVLYNPYAKSLRKAGYDGIAKAKDINEFERLWNEQKKVIFDDEMLAGRQLINAINYESNLRYAVYGTGTYGKQAYDDIKNIGSEVVFFCDSSEKKQGGTLNGLEIYPPKHLVEVKGTFDKIVIAALAYKDIRNVILKNGFTDGDIVAPIF